jgi:Collagen triple helix repeat (20 copies)
MKVRRPVLTVGAIAAVVALGTAGTAGAHAFITGSDIKNGSVTGGDIKNGSLTGRDIENHSITHNDLTYGAQNYLKGQSGAAGTAGTNGTNGQAGANGQDGAAGAQGPAGPAGAAGADGKDATYVGPHWGEVDRNTTPGASATLRSGPFESAFGNNLKPVDGEGSLQISTGANTKVDFGNEVDFVGANVADLNDLSYYVYTTQENIDAAHGDVGNLPLLRLEVNPGALTAGGTKAYASLVFIPNGTGVTQGTFSKIDATDDAAGKWYFTGSTGTATGCALATPCTLAQINAAAPHATISTLSIGKGSDYAFVGAVDDLRVNGKVYDFEPFGVYERNAS